MTQETKNQDIWAVIELMGHVTLAGRITKPGDFGALWQVDIPEGDTYRSEFFGNASVYRIRIVSEEIARAYATPRHEVVEYDAPIVTRAEHENAMSKAREEVYLLRNKVEQLSSRLVAVNSLPPRIDELDEEAELA